MPSVKWIVLLAIIMACAIMFLIKRGAIVKTEEPSIVRPGQTVETYHEHATSEYLRAKAQIRQIQKTQQEQTF